MCYKINNYTNMKKKNSNTIYNHICLSIWMYHWCSYNAWIVIWKLHLWLCFYPWVMVQSAWYRRVWLCKNYLSLSISLFFLQNLPAQSLLWNVIFPLCKNTNIWKLWWKKKNLMTNIHYKIIIAHMANYTVAYITDIVYT